MKLVIWQKNPSMHQTGALRELARLSTGKVVVVYETGLPLRRSKLGWVEPPAIEYATTYYLNGVVNPQKWITEFLEKNRGAVHLTNALRGSIIHEVVYPILRRQRAVWGLICEKPDFRGKMGALKWLWYFMHLCRLKRHVGLFFCIGSHAGEWLRQLGVDEQKIQNFAYQLDPLVYGEFSASGLRRQMAQSASPVQFVYIGQFSNRKGIDLLLSALEQLPLDGWQLDFYGYGGGLQSQVQSACSASDRLNFRGVVETSKVLKTLAQYDICVVPSRYDGWGVVVGEALTAGIGVITTSCTGAKDLVHSSGAGVVVVPNSTDLLEAMKSIITSHSVVDEWSAKALDYRVELNAAAYGKCLYDALIALNQKSCEGLLGRN